MAAARDTRDMRLRQACESDLTVVAALLQALGYMEGGGDSLAAVLEMTLHRPDMALFLAVERGGTALGMLGLSQRPQLQLGGMLVSIDTLAVRADARGRGVGRRLMRRAWAYARLHHAVRIEVHTTRARENYRRGFYPANGYQEANSALFRYEISHTAVRYDQAAGETAPVTDDEARMRDDRGTRATENLSERLRSAEEHQLHRAEGADGGDHRAERRG